jgi:hypothetical protein
VLDKTACVGVAFDTVVYNECYFISYRLAVLSGGLPLPSGQIFVGSVGNVATPQALGAGILT